MTYSTLSIQRYEPGLSEEAYSHYATKSMTVINLDHLANRSAPHLTAAWANERGLTVHYVDNEWVRIPVAVADILEFAATLGASAEVARTINEWQNEPGQLCIVSEEF